MVSQLQLVFLATFRWLGGAIRPTSSTRCFPALEDVPGSVPATVLHNAPGALPADHDRHRARLLDGARETLDVVNPYVTDRRMIGRIEGAARRGVEVRLFVPAKANNWPCAAAQRFHHEALLDAGVRILGHPAMLHAKAFVRDGEDVLVGHVQPRGVEPQALLRDRRARALAARSPRSSTSASWRPPRPRQRPGGRPPGALARLESAAFAAVSPLL